MGDIQMLCSDNRYSFCLYLLVQFPCTTCGPLSQNHIPYCEGNTDDDTTTQKILKVKLIKDQYPTSAADILSLYVYQQ